MFKLCLSSVAAGSLWHDKPDRRIATQSAIRLESGDSTLAVGQPAHSVYVYEVIFAVGGCRSMIWSFFRHPEIISAAGPGNTQPHFFFLEQTACQGIVKCTLIADDNKFFPVIYEQFYIFIQ